MSYASCYVASIYVFMGVVSCLVLSRCTVNYLGSIRGYAQFMIDLIGDGFSGILAHDNFLPIFVSPAFLLCIDR
jgi:hypothetical protein